MSRDKSKDGLGNRLESFALTRFAPLWRFIQSRPSLEKEANRFLVNRAVLKARTRPHPLSLRSDYPSWSSLTDRRYTGRHLPPAEDAYTINLPSVENVVEAFRRPSGKEKLSQTSTQLFGHFAQWFTDGFLRTDRTNYKLNTSNHEIDLSPVYGRTPWITHDLRCHEGGLLKSQRLNGQEYPPYYFNPLGQPKEEFEHVEMFYRDDLPQEQKQKLFAMGVERANVQFGYVMLNVLCLREHNRLCRELHKHEPSWDDERLFQTARNVLIAIVIKIAVEEYINHIAPYHFQFRAQPDSFYESRWYRPNWMTMEFNLLYRWHGLVTDTIRIGDTDFNAEDTLFKNQILIDRGLGAAFDDSSRFPCGQIGLLNTSAALLRTDKASLNLGRSANLRPYNDYRKYCGYPPVTSFEQITGDVDRQEVLRELYESPDQVELYVGLFAEDTRSGSPLSPLIGRMVGIDAFSQALTNPLLSEHVYNQEDTFGAVGLETLKNTNCLSDLVQRNIPGEDCNPLVSFDLLKE